MRVWYCQARDEMDAFVSIGMTAMLKQRCQKELKETILTMEGKKAPAKDLQRTGFANQRVQCMFDGACFSLSQESCW